MFVYVVYGFVSSSLKLGLSFSLGLTQKILRELTWGVLFLSSREGLGSSASYLREPLMKAHDGTVRRLQFEKKPNP